MIGGFFFACRSIPSRVPAIVVAASLALCTSTAHASWSAWLNLGGAMTTEPPSCISHSNNRVDCFVRGTDGAMYDRFWNGLSWEAWAGFGRRILEEPHCVSWAPNRIDCFARGTDFAMYHLWWDSTQWSGWISNGGHLLNRPECLTNWTWSIVLGMLVLSHILDLVSH
jgi:hypothetical protein